MKEWKDMTHKSATCDQRGQLRERFVESRTFALPHGQQAVLGTVAEGPFGGRLKVSGVDAPTGH